MPSPTQIIPTHTHPHVERYINDNTSIPEDGVNIPVFTGVNTLVLTTADQGRDNVLVDIRDRVQAIEEFGYPNFKKHGQPMYNADKFLAQDDFERRVWVYRATAEDATYANSIVVARVKQTAGTPAIPGNGSDVADIPAVDGKLDVKIEVVSSEDLNDKGDIAAEFNLLRNQDAADNDGYETFPLFAVVSKGRGQYGNAFRYRIVKDKNSDQENIFTNYYVQLYQMADELLLKKTISGSLYEGALEGNNTICIEDMLEGDNDPRVKMNVFINQESLDELYDLYASTVEDPIRQEGFDYLYGFLRNSEEKIPGYVIAPPAVDAVTVDSVEAVPLVSGHDGLLDPKRYKEAFEAQTEKRTYEKVVEDLFLAALEGEHDSRIKSRKRAPLHFVVDANYPTNVKNALSTLALRRADFQLTLDAGLHTTLASVTEWLSDYLPQYPDRNISQECTSFKIRDPYTSRKIPMTVGYWLAGRFVESFSGTENLGTTVVGPRAELIDQEIIYTSIVPGIDQDDKDLLETFYKKNVNTFVATGERVYARLSQQTTQTKQTDLTEESNVRVLLDIDRRITNFCYRLLYSTTQEDDIAQFNETINEYAALWFPQLVQSINMEFSQTEYERKRNILHCYVAVVFKGLAKRILLEIDVNPRD